MKVRGEPWLDGETDETLRRGPARLLDCIVRPFLLEWCEPVAGRRVLELGCGGGRVARALQRRGARRVVGVDVPEALQAARVHEERQRLGIEYVEAGPVDLSAFADGSFDLVVAANALQQLDRRATSMATGEVRRVLAPGGRFVFAVPHPSLPFVRPAELPFFLSARRLGYFSARDCTLSGRAERRDGIDEAVESVHLTLQDRFRCLAAAGFAAMPELAELHVTDEHLELDQAFFGPLHDVPLFLAMRVQRHAALR
jgi:SAM-dependent methyltransferase